MQQTKNAEHLQAQSTTIQISKSEYEAFNCVKNHDIDGFIDAVKEGKIKGVDLSDPEYQGMGGWANFRSDLQSNPSFKKLLGSMSDRESRHWWARLENGLMHEAGDGTYHGNSWFQKAFGLDSSTAEAQASKIYNQMQSLHQEVQRSQKGYSF